VIDRILAAVADDPSIEITVDVERLVVEVPSLGIVEPFPMDASVQHRFLEGLDDIGLTLRHADRIAAYEATRPAWMPTVTP
jgi:3-isopropylmalate/(R)-2-methylmalate dehydratase small subunit